MYKGVYSIEKWKGKRTWFHKKYRVFDGLGSVFFDTLIEARSYVAVRSQQLQKMYEDSKSFYKLLVSYYFDKLISFRVLNADNNRINVLLSDCLDCFKFLSKEIYSQYILSKLKNIYRLFISISALLKMTVLNRTLHSSFNGFFLPYPVFDSRNKPVQIGLVNRQNFKRCV